MIFFSPRSSGARSRWCKAASSPACVSSDGFSSPASNATALSYLKSSAGPGEGVGADCAIGHLRGGSSRCMPGLSDEPVRRKLFGDRPCRGSPAESIAHNARPCGRHPVGSSAHPGGFFGRELLDLREGYAASLDQEAT